MKLEIPLSVLRILAPFCSSDDTRESICGVAVTDGCATATDGHRLLYCESGAIVARDVAKGKTALVNARHILGGVRIRKGVEWSVRIEGDTPAEAVARFDGSNSPPVAIGEACTLVEYPDWRRACIPKIGQEAVSVYANGRYIADFGTAAVRIREYLGSASNLIRFRPGVDNKCGITVDFGNTDADAAKFIGILMPIVH